MLKACNSESGGKLIAIQLVGAKKNLWARILKRKERSSQNVDAMQEKDLLIQIRHENVVAFERFYQF